MTFSATTGILALLGVISCSIYYANSIPLTSCLTCTAPTTRQNYKQNCPEVNCNNETNNGCHISLVGKNGSSPLNDVNALYTAGCTSEEYPVCISYIREKESSKCVCTWADKCNEKYFGFVLGPAVKIVLHANATSIATTTAPIGNFGPLMFIIASSSTANILLY